MPGTNKCLQNEQTNEQMEQSLWFLQNEPLLGPFCALWHPAFPALSFTRWGIVFPQQPFDLCCCLYFIIILEMEKLSPGEVTELGIEPIIFFIAPTLYTH